MSRYISVDSGEVVVARPPSCLCTSPLGSCVAVAAYDPRSGIGGIAHVMLPGRCPKHSVDRKTRYAEDAVLSLIRGLGGPGADVTGIRAFLVGGADVLGDGHESPGPETVRSVTGMLGREGIGILASRVGGTQRRSCTLDPASGRVTYTEGGSGQLELWSANSE